MSNPWKKVAPPKEVKSITDIMSEELAKGLQIKEDMKFAEHVSSVLEPMSTTIEPTPVESNTEIASRLKDDAAIANCLQCQFDDEYDEGIKRLQNKKNGKSKVSVSLENYRFIPESLLYESGSKPEECSEQKYWDRFEVNEKEYASLPKHGFVMKNGEMVTKHDSTINGRRNACRVMSLPLDVCTGDGAGFDMKLSNPVFNHLREQTKRSKPHKNKLDRTEHLQTTMMVLDNTARLILFKWLDHGLFENINGIIFTGKESVVFHANGDKSYPDLDMPKECAIKIYKTSLNSFKARDKYIESDYRFKNRYVKQNPRKNVNLWAEKEMHNLLRLQKIGINCPRMVVLKKNILVMSFIGKVAPAPYLKLVDLDLEQWQSVYNEIVDAMHKMFNVGHFIHADLSEYNILWWDNKCWFIDVSQSVQPDHPDGLQFLLRDCRNITHFFEKKGTPNIKTCEELFKHVTGFHDVDINMLEGVHLVYNAMTFRFEVTLDDSRNMNFAFNYIWDKTNDGKYSKSESSSTEESSGDEFDVMWKHTMEKKAVDSAANYATLLHTISVNESPSENTE